MYFLFTLLSWQITWHLKTTVFWDVTHCILLHCYQHIPPKWWHLSMRVHGVGCAMARAVSCWPPTAETHIWSQANPCAICSGPSGKQTGFPSCPSVSPVSVISTMLQIHDHLWSLIPHNLYNWNHYWIAGCNFAEDSNLYHHISKVQSTRCNVFSVYFHKLLHMFQVGFSAHHHEHKNVHTASGIVKPIMLPAAIVDEMELHSISSTTAAGSSIGLTIPDALYIFLCSWWWAEKPAWKIWSNLWK